MLLQRVAVPFVPAVCSRMNCVPVYVIVASFTGVTVIETVATLLLSSPSLALKVKLSGPS